MYILHLITSLEPGGAQYALTRLASANVLNHHIIVSLKSPDPSFLNPSASNISLHCLHLDRPLYLCRALSLLFRLPWTRISVIQSWLYHADLLASFLSLLTRKPLIWNIRCTDPQVNSSNALTAQIARLCSFLSYSIPRFIITPAVVAKDAHIKLGYDPSKFRVIPNGYDFTCLYPSSDARTQFRDELSINDQTFLVGMIARYDPFKDYPTLLRAFKIFHSHHPSSQLLLIGTNNTIHNSELCYLISSLDLAQSVHLLGHRNDIPTVLNGLDVHVLSSLSEGFPNVIVEAIACGCLSVSTSAGDSPIIVGKYGWTSNIHDPSALALNLAHCYRLWLNPLISSTFRTEARNHITSKYSIAVMVESYDKIWKQVSI